MSAGAIPLDEMSGMAPAATNENTMHKLKMTATKAWVNIPRTTDSTGKLLAEPKTSPLAGKIAIELWTDRMALAELELPVFIGKRGIEIGDPDRGTHLGDALIEPAKTLALKAWQHGTAEVEL